MRTLFYVLHWNDVWPIRCHHSTHAAARAEVAEQLRDFRRLGLRAKTLRRGNKWEIGVEIVCIVWALDRRWKNWPRVPEPKRMIDLVCPR